MPTGKRGKAGGIVAATSPTDASAAAARILGMDIAGHTVEKVLVEQQANIAHELYAAILNDPDSKGPLIMFSDMGGMDIEEIAETQPQHLVNVPVSITEGPDNTQLAAAIEPLIAANKDIGGDAKAMTCLLYTSPSPRDATLSRMPSSA